jgi:outer membrane protein
MRTIIYALMVLLLIPSWAAALTSQESVSMALENSHRVKRFVALRQSAHESYVSARGAFMPSVDMAYSYAKSSEQAFSTLDETSSLSLTASYNIFSGMSDYYGLYAAEAGSKAAMYHQQSEESNVRFNAKLSFTNVLGTQSAVQTFAEAVELLERQSYESKLYYEQGLIAKNDLLKIEVELSSTRQDLLQAQGNLSLAISNLEKVIGRKIGSDEVIEDYEVLPYFAVLTYESLKDEMLAGRSELRQLKLLEEAQRHAVKATEGSYWPSVDMSVSYYSYGDDFSPTSRSYSYDQQTLTMLTASWNLFDGFSKYSTSHKAALELEALKEQYLETEDELLHNLRVAIEQYTISEGKLKVAKASISQAEENYRVTELQFRERVSTSTDMILARSQLTRAKNQLNSARYDLYNAAALIERATERP